MKKTQVKVEVDRAPRFGCHSIVYYVTDIDRSWLGYGTGHTEEIALADFTARSGMEPIVIERKDCEG